VIALSLLVIALGLVLARRSGVAVLLAVAAVALAWIWSTPIGARATLAVAAAGYPEADPARLAQAPVIVVLGGGMVARTGSAPADVRFFGDTGRVDMAARLFAAGRAPLVLATGGNPASFSRGAMTEAEGMDIQLRRLGVPAEAIRRESESRSTAENAANVARLLSQAGIGEIILVTSRSHMRRAVMHFEANGLIVLPAPSGDLPHADPVEPRSWKPDWTAYNQSGIGLRELAATLLLATTGR
jgi:uncharacterized SAM-binding protein YcdF (DUF218 family)